MTHFVKTNHGGRNFMVSDEVIELLQKNHISGWKTYPVEVYTEEGMLLKGLNGFTITGRCGAVKPSLCEEVIIPPAYKGGPSVPGYKGDPLDLESWDGSDIFILEHTCYKYVTEKVQKILSKLTYSNVAFVDSGHCRKAHSAERCYLESSYGSEGSRITSTAWRGVHDI